jgi:PTS system fructose-specific IIC component
MKTLLIIDSELGQARAYMAKTLLGAAAQKAICSLSITPVMLSWRLFWRYAAGRQRAERQKSLAGRHQSRGGSSGTVPQRSEEPCFPVQAPVATAPAASSGPKRIVAVTACPTGVAHTFMAAEAIETEAKKRGWWVKVETRGSVGAGNAITPEEVAQADLVIVAADIEVDLAKFAGKPMYRTTTGLGAEENGAGVGQSAGTEANRISQWRYADGEQ